MILLLYQVYMLLRQELDALKKKQKLAIDDNNSLTLKVRGKYVK